MMTDIEQACRRPNQVYLVEIEICDFQDKIFGRVCQLGYAAKPISVHCLSLTSRSHPSFSRCLEIERTNKRAFWGDVFQWWTETELQRQRRNKRHCKADGGLTTDCSLRRKIQLEQQQHQQKVVITLLTLAGNFCLFVCSVMTIFCLQQLIANFFFYKEKSFEDFFLYIIRQY